MERKVTVTATPSKVKTISVNKATVANEITATPDTSLYYSNLSKQWATKIDGLVVGEDYSSKYYAENAKISAETAKMEASTATGLKDLLKEDFDGYTENLNDTKNIAIEEINTTSTVAIGNINTVVTSSTEQINNITESAIQEVQASTIPVLQEIETVTIVANNIDTVTDIGENLDNILNKTVKVGKTTTGETGTQASVVNSGTNLNPVLDFTIPRGDKGDNGGMVAVYEDETLNLFSESGTMLQPRWGMVTGDITSQTDLQNEFSKYQLKTDGEPVAVYLGDDFSTTYGTTIETMTLTGGSYNTMATGLVMPVDGYYVVSVSLLLKDASKTAGKRILCNLLLNTDIACAQSTVTTQTTNANNICGLTSIAKCNANDKFTIQIANGLTTNLEIGLSKFSAVKIGG